MMSGFYSNGENFDRIFITEHQLYEQFIGTRLFGFGANASGQLGTNDTTARSVPANVSGTGNTWKQISLGAGNAAAVKADGTLFTWGVATYGVLGNNSTTASRSSPGQTSIGGTDWKFVSVANHGGAAASGRFCVALKLDGRLFTWGYNASGQLGTGNTTNRSTPAVITSITDWNRIACGSDHTLAIRSNGQLYSWGLNSSGQLGTGNTTNRSSPQTMLSNTFDWVNVAAGAATSAAIKADGTLWTWGANASGKLGNNSTTNTSSPNTVSGGGTNWLRISVGAGSHCAATKTDGSLWTWGLNSAGQLGNGSVINRSSPGTTAGGGTDWNEVSAGSSHCVGAKNDGTLWSWGANASTQLGDGSNVSRSSPSTVTGGVAEWQKVAAGAATTTANTGSTLASSLFLG